MYSIEMSEAGNRPPVPQHLSGLPRQGMAGRPHHELCDPGPKRDPPEAILDTLPGLVRLCSPWDCGCQIERGLFR